MTVLKLKSPGVSTLIPLLCMATLHAGTRTSADYSMTTDTVDSGGCRTTSANYTNDGSAGLVAGISSGSPATVVKSGYIAQLADVTGITLSVPRSTVAETATIQIHAAEVLDDDTTNPVPAESVAWSVQSGPLSGVSDGGLATAGNVYQNTQATVAASHLGFHAALALTVLNTGTDDFGGYAADGLPDDWQVRYFGQNNPLAAPDADASGTGQNNQFKWTAGLKPVDGSRFMVAASPVPGEPGKMRFSFSPLVAGRTYHVQYSDTLPVRHRTAIPTSDLSGEANPVDFKRQLVGSDAAGSLRVACVGDSTTRPGMTRR